MIFKALLWLSITILEKCSRLMQEPDREMYGSCFHNIKSKPLSQIPKAKISSETELEVDRIPVCFYFSLKEMSPSCTFAYSTGRY